MGSSYEKGSSARSQFRFRIIEEEHPDCQTAERGVVDLICGLLLRIHEDSGEKTTNYLTSTDFNVKYKT